MELMTECINAHDRCDGGPCPYCEPANPLRDADTGRFVSPPSPDLHYGPDLEACAMWVWAKSMGPCTVEDVMESVRASVAQLRRLSRGFAGVYHVGCVKVEVDQGGWATCRIEGETA